MILFDVTIHIVYAGIAAWLYIGMGEYGQAKAWDGKCSNACLPYY